MGNSVPETASTEWSIKMLKKVLRFTKWLKFERDGLYCSKYYYSIYVINLWIMNVNLLMKNRRYLKLIEISQTAILQ